jgi:hypothetical protein
MNNEPSITKDELENKLLHISVSQELREDVLSMCFPPPIPRTFYLVLDTSGYPIDSSCMKHQPLDTNDTLIEVIEVIK